MLDSQQGQTGSGLFNAHDVLFDCEVLMEDGSWQRGEVLATRGTEREIGALVRWEGITAWLFRAQGRGRPNEWRRV
jgi:hypothetical protein